MSDQRKTCMSFSLTDTKSPHQVSVLISQTLPSSFFKHNHANKCRPKHNLLGKSKNVVHDFAWKLVHESS